MTSTRPPQARLRKIGQGSTMGRKGVVTYAQIEGLWERITVHLEKARAFDRDDCDNGKEMAKWGPFQCGDIEGLYALMHKTFERLERLTAKADKLIRAYARREVSDQLRERARSWAEVQSELEQIGSDVSTRVTLDEWKGKGSDAYRSLLSTQSNAVAETKGLATSQQRACEQMALLNDAIFAATRDALQTLLSSVRTQRSHYDHGGERITSSQGSFGYEDYPYGFRTFRAIAELESLNPWLRKLADPGSSDWANSVRMLDQDLTVIPDRTVVLQPNGVWPGIGEEILADPADTGTAGTANRPDIDDREGGNGGSSIHLGGGPWGESEITNG